MRERELEKLFFVARHPEYSYRSELAAESKSDIHREWVDFVTVPMQRDWISWTKEQRLDKSNAVPFAPAAQTSGVDLKERFIVSIDIVVVGEDQFEVMEVGTGGGVIVWTKERVCFLHYDRGQEMLRSLPRHPGSDVV